MDWSKEVPMYELYKNINLSPNPFIIVPDDDDDDSDDDTVFKFPPPAKYRQGKRVLDSNFLG